jgi:hypothetical protein
VAVVVLLMRMVIMLLVEMAVEVLAALKGTLQHL